MKETTEIARGEVKKKADTLVSQLIQALGIKNINYREDGSVEFHLNGFLVNVLIKVKVDTFKKKI